MAPACSSILPAHSDPNAWPSKGAHTRTSKGGFFTTAAPGPPNIIYPSLEPPPRPEAFTLLLPTPVPPPFQVMPRWLDFSGAPSLRVGIEPWQPLPLPSPILPARKPISHCTRSRAPALAPLALFTARRPLHESVTYQMPTAKTVRSPVAPIGFAGLCSAMPPTEVEGFALLFQALTLVDSPAALSVLNPSTGEFLKHCQLHHDSRYKATWDTSYANELGRLCQGIGLGTTPHSKWVAGTNTFFLIDYHNILSHKQKEICHTMMVCELRPDKDNPDCTCITIEGNCICYPGDISTNTASLELVKLLLNSVLSCKGARFSSIDLKNLYLDTPMPDPEYVCIKITDIPMEFIEEYKLEWQDRDGWIYFKIHQGYYSLPQAGILANNLLCSCRLAEGYYKVASTPGLWHHKWHPIQFCLIVNDFGVEYVGLKHFTDLLDVLKKFHGVQFNMARDKFAGIDIK
jgi:hypothetical protein